MLPSRTWRDPSPSDRRDESTEAPDSHLVLVQSKATHGGWGRRVRVRKAVVAPQERPTHDRQTRTATLRSAAARHARDVQRCRPAARRRCGLSATVPCAGSPPATEDGEPDGKRKGRHGRCGKSRFRDHRARMMADSDEELKQRRVLTGGPHAAMPREARASLRSS